MRNARQELQTGNLGQAIIGSTRALRKSRHSSTRTARADGHRVSMARGRHALCGDFLAMLIGTTAALRRVPSGREQGEGRAMRYYIVIPLLLAPLAGACTPDSMAASDPNENAPTSTTGSSSQLPVKQIEQILGAQGEVTGGVLDITIERTDIDDAHGPLGVTFTPAFELHGELGFQPLGKNQALLNADMAVLEPETNPFIAALLQHGLVVQAFHQHLPMLRQVWFVHFRGIGDPIALARAARAALDVTHTRLPQPPPQRPSTPLDAQRLARILHGQATVGNDGVVTVTVLRTDRILLAGVRVAPQCGISTTIQFKPTRRDDDASAANESRKANAQVCPDFSMTAEEVVPVIKRMQIEHRWFQGSVRNDETNEQPQLFWDAMVKEGDAYQLAQEIRSALDLTHSK
jgi:hypothetical protein